MRQGAFTERYIGIASAQDDCVGHQVIGLDSEITDVQQAGIWQHHITTAKSQHAQFPSDGWIALQHQVRIVGAKAGIAASGDRGQRQTICIFQGEITVAGDGEGQGIETRIPGLGKIAAAQGDGRVGSTQDDVIRHQVVSFYCQSTVVQQTTNRSDQVASADGRQRQIARDIWSRSDLQISIGGAKAGAAAGGDRGQRQAVAIGQSEITVTKDGERQGIERSRPGLRLGAVAQGDIGISGAQGYRICHQVIGVDGEIAGVHQTSNRQNQVTRAHRYQVQIAAHNRRGRQSDIAIVCSQSRVAVDGPRRKDEIAISGKAGVATGGDGGQCQAVAVDKCEIAGAGNIQHQRSKAGIPSAISSTLAQGDIGVGRTKY